MRRIFLGVAFAIAMCSAAVVQADETPKDQTVAAAEILVKDLGVTARRILQQTQPATPQRSTAFVVVHHGRIVSEQYFAPYDAHSRTNGFSMAKTVTGVLIGMLVSDGLLALDALGCSRTACAAAPLAQSGLSCVQALHA